MARRDASITDLLKQMLKEPLAQYSDRQLLERYVQSDDQAAFAEIVDRHGPMLLGLCRRQLGDVHLAEDVLQATFLVLARKAHAIKRQESLAGWLYTVAQRLVRQARMTRTAEKQLEKKAAAERQEAAPADSGWEELLRVLDEEFQRLPDRQRLPLLLCYLEGRTQDEAARQLGWSISTLKRLLDSGRELLRTRMTRRGATLGAGLFAGFLAPSAVRAGLTPALRQAVLALAKAGGKGAVVSTSVLVLANGAIRMSIFTKMILCATAAGVMSAVVAGAVSHSGPAADVGQNATPRPGIGREKCQMHQPAPRTKKPRKCAICSTRRCPMAPWHVWARRPSGMARRRLGRR